MPTLSPGQELLQAVDSLAGHYPCSTEDVAVRDVGFFRSEMLQEVTEPTPFAAGANCRVYEANDWRLEYSAPEMRSRRNHRLTLNDSLPEAGLHVVTEHMVQWRLGTLWTELNLTTIDDAPSDVLQSPEAIGALSGFLCETYGWRQVERGWLAAAGLLGEVAARGSLKGVSPAEKYPVQKALARKINRMASL